MTFADFELDPASGELRRAGVRVKIQDLPFRVLVVLLEHAGQVVTRDQLRAALWGAETFVDAEAGLNTAIAKLREALGDSADQPRFIQTVPKRGYRFIGGVVEAAPGGPEGPPLRGVAGAWMRRPLVVATVLVFVALGVGLWRSLGRPNVTTIAVVLFHNETGDAQFDQLAQQLTDGTVVALTANPAYAVIGNAAILRTPRIFADIQKIGTELRADYLVLGQLQRVNGRVIARGHFIRVLDQKHLWAKGIEGELAGLDTLVPRTIADAVDRVLSGGPQ
jgi:DNA-binding winged helix-turn-helix (wHTH) protein/TolB-like protein